MNRMGPPGPTGAVAPHPQMVGTPAGVRYVQGPQVIQRRVFPGQPQMMAPPQGHPARQMAAFKKKKRYADKIISPSLRELIPESDAYMDLLAYEQKLDATMTRKRLEIQEALKRPQKVKRKLRIYISHTFIAGHAPERDGEEGVVPMWELRVEGRLIDEQPGGQGTVPGTPAAPNPSANQPNRNVPKRKFSSFFKSLVIELDKDIYGPDNHLVEWHRTPQTNETDGFQVKRPGDKDVKCTILLLLDYQPMKFKLHPRLAKLLGIATETRPKIIEALWQYIKTHKLQDPVDRDNINNDPYLEQIFGTRRMRFMEIPQRLQGFLHQPDPLVLTHTIQHSPNNEKNTACYDIEVEMDDPVKTAMSSFMYTGVQQQQHLNDLTALDAKISDIVEQINDVKLKRDFFARFSDDPHGFIQKWLISQSKDLKTMTEAATEAEFERQADCYFQPVVQEGVYRYIYSKVQQKRAELEQSLGVRPN
ncbi:hypothetical protein QR680_015092 [Steinernema hermaphroditum]|uniref:DM2 domain-containing protein n=1 Tax=Steinernema hermaphroditum TaxID=289476 RepID=A0AA39IDQ0_9BILA|nr:hypothetical protein QR680_015092 [Steinernema hermaphroditum]